MNQGAVFSGYWRHKRLLSGGVPHFPVRRWWPAEDLCEIEGIIFKAIRRASSLLDVGAGDLRIMKKMHAAGYPGEYHTQDLGSEHPYTYHNLDEIRRTFDAILCLDVIEHMELPEGLGLLRRLTELLSPGGVLVIQTPNARCIRHPLSWDMTHRQCYNLADLWAALTALELKVEGYRVIFQAPKLTPLEWLRACLGRYVITRFLGADYADNILAIARKPS